MPNKILYVSPIWTNLEKYNLFDDAESGMPAFSEPLKYFLNEGLDINLLWIKDASSPKLKDPFFRSQGKISVRTASKWGLICSFFKILVITFFVIRKQKPATVYCHGALSVGAILAAVLCGKRTLVRVYGTNKYASELSRLGKLRFFLKYPFVYLMFSISSDVLIATDDGSRADLIFNAIGNAKEFYFLKNGLPKNVHVNLTNNNLFLCVGRIEQKKNQILAIDFFNEVARIRDNVVLLFAGEVSNMDYLRDLETAISKSKFSSRIFIVGSLKRDDLSKYYKECEAVLSFQENSNFGNVAIECLNYGCLLITFNEHLFADLCHSSNYPAALLGETVPELSERYLSLSFEEKQIIRNNGRKSIAAELATWAERSVRELDILMGIKDV